MDIARLVAVGLAVLVSKGIAQSVTKCGNSGPDSYYNSTTLPYVCTFVPVLEICLKLVLTLLSSLQQSMGERRLWIFLHDSKDDWADFPQNKTVTAFTGQEQWHRLRCDLEMAQQLRQSPRLSSL